MLKIISSKNEGEIYKLARSEKENFEKKLNLKVGNFLDCNTQDAQVFAENISIFGDKNAYIIRISREEEISDLNTNVFTRLDNSEHLFVVIGAGSDFEKGVQQIISEDPRRSSEIRIQKIEERKVFDFPSELVAALQKHDKKNSWNLLLKELSKKDAEPIHGSCIFAYKSLSVVMNDPKKNSLTSGVKDFTWKQAATNAKFGKRERGEVTDKYFNLILSYHKARSGEMDLAKQLEKWVLEN